jgi:hypothetical protein
MRTQTLLQHIKLSAVVMLISSYAFTSVSYAAIPQTIPSASYDGVDLDLTQINKVESARDIHQADVAQVIPTNMQASEDTFQVGKQIADHAFSNWLKSEQIRSSNLGRSAETIQQNLQHNVSLGKTGDNGVEHKVNFQIQPGTAQAIVKYTGMVNANLSYRASNAEWKLELSQKLASSTDLVVYQTSRSDERTNNISVRWTF